MNTNEDRINHTIVVDNNTKVILSIPLEITAMELKGLMTKASKMFNLSEMDMGLVTAKRSYNRSGTSTSPRSWSDEERQLIKDNYGKKSIVEIAKLFPNRQYKTIYSQIGWLKRKGQIKTGKRK